MSSKRRRNQVEDQEQLAVTPPRRRQPLRRCKKFRYNGNMKLLDLPEDMMRVILEFSNPTKEQEGWIWLCKMGRVCRLFHEIVKALPPTVLDVIKAFNLLPSQECHALFLRSILNNEWMRAKLTEFAVTDASCACGQCHRKVVNNNEVFHAIRSLLEKEGALPNLEILSVELCQEDGNNESPKALLRSLANLSSLKKLWLTGVGSTGITTPEMFERLMSTLSNNTLESFALFGAPWLNDELVERFLRRCGDRLTELALCPNRTFGTLLVSDGMLRAVSHYCLRLERLRLDGASFTSEDLQTFLGARGSSLQHLELTECANLDIAAVDAIVKYAPNLYGLALGDNRWLTNDLLDRLVRGFVNNWRGRPAIGMPLKMIRVQRTSISSEALVQIAYHIVSARSSGITVYGSGWEFHGRWNPDDTILIAMTRVL